MKPATFEIAFVKKEQQATDTYSFYFTYPDSFTFISGQYMRISLPVDTHDDRGASRFFSISSSPHKPKYLVITTKIIQSAFKKSLEGLEIGQKISIFGPLGRLLLHDEEKVPLIFLAGGIGITPFYSMLQYAVQKRLELPMTLVVSYRVPDDILWHQELGHWQTEHEWFGYIPTVTEPNKAWKGDTGYIDANKLKKYATDLYNSRIYIVGSPVFVTAMKELLQSLRIPEENIIVEEYSGF